MAHDQRLMVKMTAEEKQRLEQIADRDGMNLSTVVRTLINREHRRVQVADSTTEGTAR